MQAESGQMADPHKARELWTEVVRSASDRGKLEKIPTKIARTKKEKAQARTQNHWLSRKTFGGFGENYDLIEWESPA